MNFCVKSKYFKPSIINSIYRFTSTTEIVEQPDQPLFDDEEETKAREAAIEKKRNISRLSNPHFNLIHGIKPYHEPKTIAHLTVKYNRKMYGKYGVESGVNPSICWPSKREIEDIKEYESIAFPFTINKMIETEKQKRREEQEKIQLRQNEILTKFAKLEQWKNELQAKITKKEAEAKAAKEKKERLVEEVRRHFGFKLDPRDERFQEMLAKREKEQRKLEKLAKREAKEKVMIAKLQQKNSEISDKVKS